ncbi:HAMP domain-containing histidine kinase [Patescibacteria group bacterium]|nr:HAMP domain-containing histidine kinase [Patescibacteria group bacterium]
MEIKEKIENINKNCWLIKSLNYSPYRRCQFCELKFHNCLFLHYQIISLVLIFIIFLASFLIEGVVSKLLIISIFALVIVYGYFFNKSTDKIIHAYLAQRKVKEALEKLTEGLEDQVEKRTSELKKANEELKELDVAKSDFISIASHQLRTPLTVIKGYISMMIEGNFGELTDLEKESLEKVFQSNERLIRLVENLLNISRIESGRLQFNFVEVDLGKIAISVIEELSSCAKKKALLLKYKQSIKKLPLVKVDEDKIRQVMMNLIDNSIKYTKKGKIVVEIKLVKKQIHFCVTDSGMGIKQEDMANLFKKFSRCNGTFLIHTEGVGLGLYVARIMIEQHHGKLWAESLGEGKGSKFCFELPLKNKVNNKRIY